MGQPLPLRPDYDGPALRAAARRCRDAAQAWCLLALAAIFHGASRTEAARIGAVTVTVQIIRDWVVRFNALGPDGLVNRKPPGSRPRLTAAHRAALTLTIEAGPIPASHGVARWRLVDLGQWLWEEFRVSVSKQTLSRELRAMCYRKLSARPRHHAQAEGAMDSFKIPSPSRLEEEAVAHEKGATIRLLSGRLQPFATRSEKYVPHGPLYWPGRGLPGMPAEKAFAGLTTG
jgi:hypothetical protein